MKNMGNAFEKVDQRKLVTQNVRQCTRRFAKSEQANSMSNVSTRIRVFGWCEILLQLCIYVHYIFTALNLCRSSIVHKSIVWVISGPVKPRLCASVKSEQETLQYCTPRDTVD